MKSSILRLTGLLFVLAGLAQLSHWRGGFSALFLFYTIAFSAVLVTALMLLQNRQFSVKRSCQPKIRTGEPIQVEVTVHMAGKLPVFWIRMRDEWHQQWLFPGFRRMVHYTYTIEDVRRGKFYSEQIELRREDPLGLLSVTKAIQAPLAFVVLPKPQPWNVSRWLQQVTTDDEWHELRHYREGDSLQRMHWKLSAKRQQWIVRESSMRLSPEWTVLLDGAEASWNKERKWRDEEFVSPAFERAVEMVAQFVQKVGQKAACGILCCGRERIEMPARLGKQAGEVPDSLAIVQPNGEKLFAEVLQQEIPRLPAGAGVLCVTSKLTPALARTLAQLSKAGRRQIVCLLCNDEERTTRDEVQAIAILHVAGCHVVHDSSVAGGGVAGA